MWLGRRTHPEEHPHDLDVQGVDTIALLPEETDCCSAELLRVLQHAEVTDVRENDERRSRDGPGQILGVLRFRGFLSLPAEVS